MNVLHNPPYMAVTGSRFNPKFWQGKRETKVIDNSITRLFIPYYASAVLAQKTVGSSTEWWTGIFGLLVHVATWTVVVGYDSWLLVKEFNDTSDTSMKHLLQIAATVTVWLAAGIVIVLTLSQIIVGILKYTGIVHLEWAWTDGLLPPFLSSAIIANVRASLEFTKFLLFFSIFQPVVETQGANEVSRHVKCILVMLIVLKQYGISMTMSQHRTKVYDDAHETPVSLSMQ